MLSVIFLLLLMCSSRFPLFFSFLKSWIKELPQIAIQRASDCSQFMRTRSGDNAWELRSFDLVPHFEECSPWNVIVSILLRTS
jgi:hypothetical protein